MTSSVPPEFRNLPLQAPPPGVTPNFINPESSSYKIYVAAGICLPLILAFAGVRMYVKTFITRAWTRDDYSFLLALLAGCTYISLTLALAAGGAYGLHAWDVTIGILSVEQIRSSLVNSVIYAPFIWFVKLSLFLLYLQVFGSLRWLKYLVYIGITLTGLFYFSSMIAFIVLCAPRDGQSQPSYLNAISSPRCAENKPVILIQGAVNIISDFYLLIIPLPPVWALQLPRWRKVGVSAIFLTGLSACGCSIMSLIYRIRLITGQDNTWTVVPLWVVTMMEMSAGVMVPCMPSLVAFYRHFNRLLSVYWNRDTKRPQRRTSSSGGPRGFQVIDAANNHWLDSDDYDNNYRMTDR